MGPVAPSYDDAGPSFGYHPDLDALQVVIGPRKFSRALVLDQPVRGLIDDVNECRVLRGQDVALPERDLLVRRHRAPLVMQVTIGAAPGAATITSVGLVEDAHLLMSALGRAQELWRSATVVPAPKYQINDSAVATPGDLRLIMVPSSPRTSRSALTARLDSLSPLSHSLGGVSRTASSGATLPRAAARSPRR